MPKQKASDKTERKLSTFLHNQRSFHKVAQLPACKIALLDEIPGWRETSPSVAWKLHLDSLRAWLHDHDQVYPQRGSADVTEKPLDHWVQRQLKHFKADDMPQDRRALLEELPGWSKKACRYSSERLTPLRKAKPRFRFTTKKLALRVQPQRRARCE